MNNTSSNESEVLHVPVDSNAENLVTKFWLPDFLSRLIFFQAKQNLKFAPHFLFCSITLDETFKTVITSVTDLGWATMGYVFLWWRHGFYLWILSTWHLYYWMKNVCLLEIGVQNIAEWTGQLPISFFSFEMCGSYLFLERLRKFYLSKNTNDFGAFDGIFLWQHILPNYWSAKTFFCTMQILLFL